MAKSILFVCLGNICRSPIAEGIAKKIIKNYKLGIIVDSAGTGDWHIGNAPCEGSQKIALMNGVDISTFKARQVVKDDFNKFDLIVALDNSNYINLKKLGAKNLVKLGDYGFNGADVPDPYFLESFDGFDEVYDMIEKAIKNLISKASCHHHTTID